MSKRGSTANRRSIAQDNIAPAGSPGFPCLSKIHPINSPVLFPAYGALQWGGVSAQHWFGGRIWRKHESWILKGKSLEGKSLVVVHIKLRMRRAKVRARRLHTILIAPDTMVQKTATIKKKKSTSPNCSLPNQFSPCSNLLTGRNYQLMLSALQDSLLSQKDGALSLGYRSPFMPLSIPLLIYS